ncbi:MAG: hypothetical protein FD180_2640 [Planctomycetota bacterium]|nr:MAG: hypothetical protein FD180_2640 [Planctomycetota bacterium]
MKRFPAGALMAALALLACGCSSNESASEKPAAKAAFDLEGWRLIGCCCGSPCPCRVNKKPLHCHGCDHSDAVHIDKGYAGHVDFSGMTWVVVGRGFGQDTKENWVYVYVADTATEEQYKALGEMLTADLKSWGDKAAHLAGKFVGMRKVPLTTKLDADGRGWTVSIPGILELKTRAIVNPGRTEPVRSTGVMDAWGDSFTHCEPVTHTLTDKLTGYSWNLSGRQANFAEFHLTPEKKAAGGGWGCWTANAEYGDKGPYEEQLKDEHK